MKFLYESASGLRLGTEQHIGSAAFSQKFEIVLKLFTSWKYYLENFPLQNKIIESPVSLECHLTCDKGQQQENSKKLAWKFEFIGRLRKKFSFHGSIFYNREMFLDNLSFDKNHCSKCYCSL